MKDLNSKETTDVGGGLDPRLYETQVAPEPSTTDPNVVIDHNPPVQPQ